VLSHPFSQTGLRKERAMDAAKNPFKDMNRARREMEHLMRQVFGKTHPLLSAVERKWQPNVDVFEHEENFIIVVELAGVSHEDISVVFHDGRLWISGVRKDEIPYADRKYLQMEISYNEFERVIYLPNNVDVENISAKLNNGFMVIKAPVMKSEGPKTIEWR
jgi:HSP20 family protein